MNLSEILAVKANKKVEEVKTQINSLAAKTVVTLNHQFADVTARDTYFTAHPTELLDKLFIKVGTGYQQYLEGAWVDVSAVISEMITADQQALADIGNHFTNKTTEGALQEVASELSNLATEVNEKANIQQEEWITPTLLNGLTEETPIRYMKDAFGFVHLKGVGLNAIQGNAVFSLPIGYKPSSILRFACVSNNTFIRVSVQNTGYVIIDGLVNLNKVALDGITFKAEA